MRAALSRRLALLEARQGNTARRMHSSIRLAGSGGRLAFLLTGHFPSHYRVRRRKDHERCEYRYSSKFFHVLFCMLSVV